MTLPPRMPSSDWFPIEALRPPKPTAPDRSVPWKWWDILLAVIVGLLVGGFAVAFAFELLPDSIPETSASGFFVASGLIYVSVLYFSWLLVLRRRGATFRDIGLKRPAFGAILLMVPILLATFVVEGVVAQIVNELIGTPPTAEEQLFARDAAPQVGMILPWLLVVVAVFAPVVEEILFRGILYRYLRSRMKIGYAMFLSAVIFAASHGQWLLIPSLTVLGLVLAYVYERYESIWVPMTFHALNNAVVVILVFAVH